MQTYEPGFTFICGSQYSGPNNDRTALATVQVLAPGHVRADMKFDSPETELRTIRKIKDFATCEQARRWATTEARAHCWGDHAEELPTLESQPMQLKQFREQMIVGSRWRVTAHTAFGQLGPYDRTVVKVRTNSLALSIPDKEEPSWLDMPKAKNILQREDGAILLKREESDWTAPGQPEPGEVWWIAEPLPPVVSEAI